MTATFDVSIRGLPPELLKQGVEFSDEVFREIRLAGSAVRELADELDRLTARIYGAGDGREVMLQAFRVGDVDVDMQLPVGAERDLVELGLYLERVDEACRSGQLLALPRSPELVAMSWWTVTEVIRRRHGLPASVFSA